jgi:uncharacterized OB-fold protein
MTAKPVPEITDFNRPYFEGCAQGELRVRTCRRCHHRFRFSHYLCPNCWSDDLGWEPVSGRGTVTHFTVVHQAPYPSFEADAPYVIVLVELEVGVRMMGNLLQCDPEEVRIGLPVRAVYEARGDVSLPMFVLDR